MQPHKVLGNRKVYTKGFVLNAKLFKDFYDFDQNNTMFYYHSVCGNALCASSINIIMIIGCCFCSIFFKFLSLYFSFFFYQTFLLSLFSLSLLALAVSARATYVINDTPNTTRRHQLENYGFMLGNLLGLIQLIVFLMVISKLNGLLDRIFTLIRITRVAEEQPDKIKVEMNRDIG